MRENYNKARRYLYKIDPTIYKDVLHDAYVNYYRRTGLNLFERSNTNVIGVVRFQYFETLRKGMYKKNGVRYPFQFTTFEDHKFNSINPLDELIQKETYETISNRVHSFQDPEIAQAVLDLRLQGYETKEIAERLNLNILQVRRYTQNLQKDRPGNKNRFTKDEVAQIRESHKSGQTLNQLSIKYNSTIGSIWLIVNNKTYEDK